MGIVTAGEALIDFTREAGSGGIRYRAQPGGSPLNVAIGLARLGVSAGFLGRLSTDPFGDQLRDHLHRNGVDPRHVRSGDAPSTLAFVHDSADGEPAFSFYGAGAADTLLTPEDLPDSFGNDVEAIHLGSIAMVRRPISRALEALMDQEAPQRVISFDPNVRPSLMPERAVYCGRLDKWLAHVSLVKASRADLAWLHPGADPVDVARSWLENGPNWVVVTLGGDGAVGVSPAGTVEAESPAVDVVDTVGAGDAFTAGLLTWLHDHDCLDRDPIATLADRDQRSALAFAAQVAALTCTRRGADPPTREELPSA